MKASTLPPPLERDIQRQIVDGLTYNGYRVLVTTVHVKLPTGQHHTGQTPGIPDLYVTRDSWGNGHWVGLEVKRPKVGKLSPAQRELADAGCIDVVTSYEEALAVMRRLDGRAKPWTQTNGTQS